MPERVTEHTAELGGRRVRWLAAGDGPQALVLLHTGVPGVAPFAGGADLLADLMDRIDVEGLRLLAPDLPGAGGTAIDGLGDLTTDGVTRFVGDLVAAQEGIEAVHVLGHGDASLAALKLARDGVAGVAVRSCLLVAPNAAAPIGDSVQNVSLLHPPAPRWTRRSQRWAIERLTYVPDRFPAPLLERLLDHAGSAAHAAAVELVAGPVDAAALLAAQIEAQDEFYAYCRDVKYQVPVTVFWGAEDPTATVARGAVLASVLSGGPAALDFHLVNRCAHFAQFDRGRQLAGVVTTAVRRAAG